ncbi:MAG: hypothetical protein ACI4C4_10595 [Lachnospiraceae bacterium]
MMSMLFCRRGGIICARESGQSVVIGENIFTELETELLEKFNQFFAFENWSQEKRNVRKQYGKNFMLRVVMMRVLLPD